MKLKDGRYELLRPLGSEAYSSTWIVYDANADRPYRYAAVKILTRMATEEHRSGTMNESAFLKAIMVGFTLPQRTLPTLLDDFEILGPAGPHLCFVFPDMGPDVTSFRNITPTRALHPCIAKKILVDVVNALCALHRINIIHADVKANNILFHASGVDELMEDELRDHPVGVVGQFELSDGTKHSVFAPRPFEPEPPWDMSHLASEALSFCLMGFGHAQWAGRQPTVGVFGSIALRAPEIVIGSDFGPRLDTWAFGCLAYELLAGEWLFNPVGSDDREMEADLLAQIFALTGERFSKLTLSRAQWSDDILDEEGNLKGREEISPTSLEARLSARGFIPDAEIKPAADFIGMCLRVNSADRPTSGDFCGDEWLYGAFDRCIGGHLSYSGYSRMA
ncbi:kinase-like protein [Ephemerocybe angulata]|uniref:non-specific serine/threonine protein kinase n=1 Tax=Ephemerocybe angulata TaxID=980116 RepID=A0A8H6I948_9AGAR|nr:kinase-like protein [Tulosesus angulatus]